MLKSSHVNIGATVSIFSIIMFWWYFSIFLLFYPFLALLDDADHNKSWITKALGLKLPWMTHRWYSHTLLFNITIRFVIYYLFKYFYPDSLHLIDLYILLRISLSHIIGDFFTKRWVPLLYPFINNSFWIPLLKTWTIIEKIITLLISFLNIGWFIYIVINYILPWKLIIPVYDIKLVLIALLINLFITYLLLKDEIKSINRNIKKVIFDSINTIIYITINVLLLIWIYYINFIKHFFDINILVEKIWLSYNIILIWIIVLWMLPSYFKVMKSINNISFEFSSLINIFFISYIIWVFALKII